MADVVAEVLRCEDGKRRERRETGVVVKVRVEARVIERPMVQGLERRKDGGRRAGRSSILSDVRALDALMNVFWISQVDRQENLGCVRISHQDI